MPPPPPPRAFEPRHRDALQAADFEAFGCPQTSRALDLLDGAPSDHKLPALLEAELEEARHHLVGALHLMPWSEQQRAELSSRISLQLFAPHHALGAVEAAGLLQWFLDQVFDDRAAGAAPNREATERYLSEEGLLEDIQGELSLGAGESEIIRRLRSGAVPGVDEAQALQLIRLEESAPEAEAAREAGASGEEIAMEERPPAALRLPAWLPRFLAGTGLGGVAILRPLERGGAFLRRRTHLLPPGTALEESADALETLRRGRQLARRLELPVLARFECIAPLSEGAPDLVFAQFQNPWSIRQLGRWLAERRTLPLLVTEPQPRA